MQKYISIISSLILQCDFDCQLSDDIFAEVKKFLIKICFVASLHFLHECCNININIIKVLQLHISMFNKTYSTSCFTKQNIYARRCIILSFVQDLKLLRERYFSCIPMMIVWSIHYINEMISLTSMLPNAEYIFRDINFALIPHIHNSIPKTLFFLYSKFVQVQFAFF